MLDAFYDLNTYAVTKTSAYLRKFGRDRRTTIKDALAFAYKFASLAINVPDREISDPDKIKIFLNAILEAHSRKVFRKTCKTTTAGSVA